MAGIVSPRERRRAIALVEESRESHITAIARIGEVAVVDEGSAAALRALTGTPAFHARCIREYDLILRVLRAEA